MNLDPPAPPPKKKKKPTKGSLLTSRTLLTETSSVPSAPMAPTTSPKVAPGPAPPTLPTRNADAAADAAPAIVSGRAGLPPAPSCSSARW